MCRYNACLSIPGVLTQVCMQSCANAKVGVLSRTLHLMGARHTEKHLIWSPTYSVTTERLYDVWYTCICSTFWFARRTSSCKFYTIYYITTDGFIFGQRSGTVGDEGAWRSLSSHYWYKTYKLYKMFKKLYILRIYIVCSTVCSGGIHRWPVTKTSFFYICLCKLYIWFSRQSYPSNHIHILQVSPQLNRHQSIWRWCSVSNPCSDNSENKPGNGGDWLGNPRQGHTDGTNTLSNREIRTSTNTQIDILVQDCSNSSALAMELLQSFTKPSIWR